MKLLILIFLSFLSFGDYEVKSTKFSDCKGKIANYYVGKITKDGSISGWLEAADLHQQYYKARGMDILVMPMGQYRRDENGDAIEKLHRVSTMVVGSQESWASWREYLDNRDQQTIDSDQIDYDNFVQKYNKNNEITARRLICML